MFSYLHYNKIQRGREAISGKNNKIDLVHVGLYYDVI